MSKLYNVNDFKINSNVWDNEKRPKIDPTWYFVDTIWYHDNFSFDISKTYPCCSTIHIDCMDGKTKIDIRRFVERNLYGDVIFKFEEMNYLEGKYGTQVQHGYYFFYFESIEDQVLFNLNYIEKISKKISKYRE